MMAVVELEFDGHIATITMNDPKHRNRLSQAFSKSINDAFIECEKKQKCRVVIIRAYESAAVWSAGHDIAEFADDKHDPFVWEEDYCKMLRDLLDSHLPVIAQVEGTVWGGGCDLAACCDMVVAAMNSTFAVTPVKLGLPHSYAGVAHFFHAYPMHMLKEIFMTAKPISAQRAYTFGFVNRLCEVENLREETLALANDVSGNAPLCLATVKAELQTFSEALTIMPDKAERIQSIRRRAYKSHDLTEGLAAFHEKRRPNFKGY